MSNKPEYYQQKYEQVLEREEKLVAFIEDVASGYYNDPTGMRLLQIDAQNVLQKCKNLSGRPD